MLLGGKGRVICLSVWRGRCGGRESGRGCFWAGKVALFAQQSGEVNVEEGRVVSDAFG